MMPRVRKTETIEPNETEVAVEEAVSGKSKRGAYQRTAPGEVVYLHKSRGTGSTIAVLKGPAELGFGPSSKWVDLCLSHRQFSIYETRVSATAMTSHSNEWCTECAAAKKGRGRRAA